MAARGADRPKPRSRRKSNTARGRIVSITSEKRLLTSTDGTAWTEPILPTDQKPLSLAYGDDFFVVVCGTDTYLTSPDGVSWTARKFVPAPKPYGPHQVRFANGIFFVAGSYHAAVSRDALTWEPVKMDSNVTGSSFSSAGDRFFSNLPSASASVATSSDGETWSRTDITGSLFHYSHSHAFGNGVYISTYIAQYEYSWRQTRIFRSSDGLLWTSLNEGGSTYRGLAYGKGMFVRGALVSSDGLNWSRGGFGWELPHRFSESRFGDRYFYINDRFFALLPAHPDLYFSTDGTSVESVASPVLGPCAIAWGAGRYVLVGGATVYVESEGQISSSSDGRSWTQRETITSNPLTDVVYAQGTFIAASMGQEIVTSADGQTWKILTLPGSATLARAWLAFGNGRFVLI